eukprot:CAMPEP_0117660440 /NCGR_PEP_ID=MMETSP0804-20121206/6970_1 /TAXON_ID=1074897 /ORGANISM="Tetraselmis astigmatica, Strain CCMP880" /LENGTH=388 /DNA_ID=CAMNT_0005467171 /DNA_START=592 /DNA_END=1758 /DNA_ORIENTATION=-
MAYWMDENFLYQAFLATGEVATTKVIRNKATGLSEGYGFIEFSSHEAAARVLQQLNGKAIPQTDQVFRLNWAAFGVGKGGTEDYSVFVGDLAPEVTDYALQEHFLKYFPTVRSAKVITDPLTGRHKSYGFVRFGSLEERDKALADMNGQQLCGRPIRVSIATAKKTVSVHGGSAESASSSSSTSSNYHEHEQGNTTLFIGGLSEEVTEGELHRIFSKYGEVVYTKIPQGKGCGFVQFVQRQNAVAAKNALHNQSVGKSTVRISWGRQQSNRHHSMQMNQSYNYPTGYYQGYYDPNMAYYDPNMYAGYYRMQMDHMYQAYQQGGMPMPQYQVPAHPSVTLNAPAASPQSLPNTVEQKYEQLGPLDIQRMNNMFIEKSENHQMAGRLQVS